MNKKIPPLMLLTNILSMAAMTGFSQSITASHELAWVGTLSGGSVWAQKVKQQTFYLTPTIEKTYSPQKSSQALFNGEIFLGLQKSLNKTINMQLGVAAGGASSAKINGEIWTDADPEFNNHAYHYKIQHAQVSLKGKILTEMAHDLLPWVSGSIGVGINKSSSFNNISLVCGELPNPNYTSETKSTLTYAFGAGLQKALNQHVQVGIGYEFSDWGKSQLGAAPEQTLNKGLGLSHFYTNGLFFNLTYIA
ncbi:outer membrane protein [Legionella feeleii]|uniref:outer membrane protein n=1 Tax=Legionella feeleii TaxID=453 RepID=UPI0010414BF9|nr:outer membrane beta-barrel protein [Legionella feeleii]